MRRIPFVTLHAVHGEKRVPDSPENGASSLRYKCERDSILELAVVHAAKFQRKDRAQVFPVSRTTWDKKAQENSGELLKREGSFRKLRNSPVDNVGRVTTPQVQTIKDLREGF